VRPVDEDGEEGPYSDVVTFTTYQQPNEYPTAELKIIDGENLVDEITGDEPLGVHFNATGSADSDGYINQYLYDWNDDGIVDFNGGPLVNHQYSLAGRYTATLIVKDDDGAEDRDSVSVTVTGPPVIHEFTVTPTSGEAPVEATFFVRAEDTDDNGVTEVYFDFDGAEGYIFVVYANAGDIRCRGLDFFDRD